MNNEQRAEAAFVAVKAFNKHMPNGDHDEVVADLLCDLMHLLIINYFSIGIKKT